MIEKTAFVLGAGASCPYGFASGRELREQICSHHVADCEHYLRAIARNEALIPQELRMAREFVDTFRKSTIMSIDLFVARNPGFSGAGKRAIIFRILAAEHASRFREETKHGDQDWYTWLFEQLTDKLVRKEDYNRFCENDISFITFNYDRSLEYFLCDSLRNSFKEIADGKIIEQVKEIEICHVFGQVGPLEWQGQHDQIEYRVDVKSTNVEALCDNIRIVYDGGENPKLEEARQLISKADRVFFLGFGYAEENLDILGIPDVLTKVRKVFGTALGFTEIEITRVEPLFKGTGFDKKKSVNIHRSVFIEDLDCLALLRKYL
jgi:hypothetical protein